MSGSSLFKFLAILQKIFLFLAITAFIPATILVFSIQAPKIDHTDIYSTAREQITTPFIVDYKRNSNNQPLCTYRESILNNEYCFRRANQKQYTITSGVSKACDGSYLIDNYTYCPGGGITEIKNEFNQITGYDLNPQFRHSDSHLPIFRLSPKYNTALNEIIFSYPTTIYFTYAPDSNKAVCSSVILNLRPDLNSQASYEIFQPFYRSLLVLWILVLCFLLLIIVSLIVNHVSKQINTRPYTVACFILYNLVIISLNSLGISFFNQTKLFKTRIQTLSKCFLNPTRDTLELLTTADFGISSQFVFFLGVVCFIISLILVGEIAIRTLQYKMYSNELIEQETSYQLKLI